MSTYEYKGFNAVGRPVRGIMEALTIKQAREKLAAKGILAEKIAAGGRKGRFPSDQRAVVYQEISSLLAAGLTLEHALNVMIDSPDRSGIQSVLAGVRDAIKEGASLASALQSVSSSVTPFERAIIEAGERSGNVEIMLTKLGDFVTEQKRLHERVQSALIYPAIVVGVGICVAVVMLGLLVPRANDILADSSVRMPWLTRAAIVAGEWTIRAGPVALILVVGSVIWFMRKLRKEEMFRMRYDRLSFRIPVIGRGRLLLVNLRFSRTLAILLDGGVSVIDALRLAGKATGSAWIEMMTARQSEQVRQGASISESMLEIPPLAASLPGWIRVGEASGGLSNLLARAGKRYEEQWNGFVERGLNVLEPILILIIGGFVLLITLAVLLPVMSLSQAIGN
ncbi:MAG: type II secretion system F family protein [Lentisphaerae bacterium]|nr:type II secretion system F family protein [Lentisphaerota bacterium]